MRIIIKLFVIILTICLISLNGCSLASSEQKATQNMQYLLETSAVLVTQAFGQTLELLPTSTNSPIPTLTATRTPTQIPTIARTRPGQTTSTQDLNCNRVSAGIPFDITIVDDTLMRPGQSFTKTWRLVNNGSCKWTRLYKLVFFSSNPLGAIQSQLMPSEVIPGASVDLSVDMVAPYEPGVYQSNWMLQSPEGEYFGLGPNGDAPFWVRIEVVLGLTQSPTIEVTGTVTPTQTTTQTPSP